jgi:hypothetical protein
VTDIFSNVHKHPKRHEFTPQKRNGIVALKM